MFNFIKKIFTKVKDKNATYDLDDRVKKLKDYTRQYAPLNVDSIAKDDYLGLAASARQRAKIAIQEKNYELAWDLYTEEKRHFFSYAEKYNSDYTNVQALDGGVSYNMANVLRLEKNHTLALVHLIYAISTNPMVAYMMKKLPAYYNRSKLNVDFEEITYFIYKQQKNPDFRTIQNKVYEWDKV